MKKKSTLTEEAYFLLKELVSLCEKTYQGDDCYKRLNRLRTKAHDRWKRRHNKALNTGKEVITNKVRSGRPRKEDKKTQINVKLPPYLISWMDRQPESRAILIETALCGHYQIPEFLQK